MTEGVIAALITAIAAMAGSALTALSGARLTAYKIDELGKEISELKERVDKLNGQLAKLDTVELSVKSAHRRIDELKEAMI